MAASQSTWRCPARSPRASVAARHSPRAATPAAATMPGGSRQPANRRFRKRGLPPEAAQQEDGLRKSSAWCAPAASNLEQKRGQREALRWHRTLLARNGRTGSIAVDGRRACRDLSLGREEGDRESEL